MSRSCMAYARKPVPAGNAEKIMELVDRLEDVKDVVEFAKLLIAAVDN